MHFFRLRWPMLLLLLAGPAGAENAVRIDPAEGSFTRFTRPFRARSVPPVSLANSPRLESLLRAGNLYLSAQDAVALAVENNLDIEVQRYGPLLALEVLRRARAGGALRSVGVGVAAGPTSVSLTGVTVTNIGTVGAAGEGVSSGGGIVTQLGPPISSFDPTVTLFTNFAHTTSPQSNTILTGTTALIQQTRSFQAQYSQNWDFGLGAQFTFYNQHTNVNSPFFGIDPYTSGYLDLQVTQNLLYGFGSAVNGRRVGTFGAAEVFSLSVTKALVSVEGGMVSSSDRPLIERIKKMRNYGIEANYNAHFPGLNGKMSEFHAVIGIYNLERLDDYMAMRQISARYYIHEVESRTGFRTLPWPQGVTHTFKDFTVIAPERLASRRDNVIELLKERGVETRAYFHPPVHEQSLFRKFADRLLPRTEALSRRVITLPFYTTIGEAEMDYVVEALGEAERRLA